MKHSPLEYIQAQLRLECIELDPEGLLVRIPCSEPDELAAVYLYEHPGGLRLYSRHDLPPRLRDQISVVPLDDSLLAVDVARPVGEIRPEKEIRAILARHLGGIQVEVFETYIFEQPPEQDPFGLVRKVSASPGEHPHFVIEQDGRVVSTCCSVRENAEAAECYTLTDEGYRRRGYGVMVTQAWGRHVLLSGKIPFYSHHADNHASRALAARLSLSWKFRVMIFTQTGQTVALDFLDSH
jgi:RimJ/RimL family protein N-acetyltransferase